MIRTIVTHPGGAHKDDLLAVCLLIAESGAPVERREPNQADLEDPQVAVVDIGGVHDPSKLCFDHHHFPREHPPTCAISLVLEHLGRYEDAKHFCDWLEPAEWFDSRGPQKTAAWLGVPRRAISRLNSPIDITLLRRFSQKTSLQSGEPLYEVMRFVGQDLLDYLKVVRDRIDDVASRVEHWRIEHAGRVIPTVFLARSEADPDEPSAALGNYIRSQSLDVAAIVYPDRRGLGYGVGRYEDHPNLDFSRVEAEADVSFAHKSGFMCKTTATEPDRLQALIRAAWTEGGVS